MGVRPWAQALTQQRPPPVGLLGRAPSVLEGRPGPEHLRGWAPAPGRGRGAGPVCRESLGWRNVAGEGSWRLGAFHVCRLVLHELLQEMMFSKTKLSLARWHQVIPANSPVGGGEAQNMRAHARPSSAVRLHNFRGLAWKFCWEPGLGRNGLQAQILGRLMSHSQRTRRCHPGPRACAPRFHGDPFPPGRESAES